MAPISDNFLKKQLFHYSFYLKYPCLEEVLSGTYFWVNRIKDPTVNHLSPD